LRRDDADTWQRLYEARAQLPWGAARFAVQVAHLCDERVARARAGDRCAAPATLPAPARHARRSARGDRRATEGPVRGARLGRAAPRPVAPGRLDRLSST